MTDAIVKLLESLTNLANRGAELLALAITSERTRQEAAGMVTEPQAAAVGETVATPPAAKRGRKPKVETPPATSPVDPFAQGEALNTAPATPAATLASDMIESATARDDKARALVLRFATPSGADKRPVGFHMAKKLIADMGGPGAKLETLNHAQRLKFIAAVDALIAMGDKAPAGMGVA